MKKFTIWILVLMLALAAISPALAEVSARIDVSWYVLSGGGGERSSSHTQVDDVLGQWADGLSSSERYRVEPGFWHSGRVAKPNRIYLPMTAGINS